METFNEKLSHHEAETFFYLDKKLENEKREKPEERNECKKCNHYPVCKDELKNNLEEICPYCEERDYE